MCWVLDFTHDVTGMSPQSMTLPQKLNGLDFMGLLQNQTKWYAVSFVLLLSACLRRSRAVLKRLTRCTRH
jgi:hypothetical protein